MTEGWSLMAGTLGITWQLDYISTSEQSRNERIRIYFKCKILIRAC